MIAPDPSRVLTTAEVAAILGCHEKTVLAMVRRGDLPAIRVGNRVRIPVVQFDRVLAGTWEKPKAPPRPVDFLGKKTISNVG